MEITWWLCWEVFSAEKDNMKWKDELLVFKIFKSVVSFSILLIYSLS